MIELIVEDYCQECPEFSPDINRTITRSWDDKTMILSTTVFCKYVYRCREIEKHFDKREDNDVADVQDNATAHKVVGGGERDGSTCWFECDNCGLAVGIGDVFCKHCGARFVP